MPNADDLETRVQLLERALAKVLGTDDFEAPSPKPISPLPAPQLNNNLENELIVCLRRSQCTEDDLSYIVCI